MEKLTPVQELSKSLALAFAEHAPAEKSELNTLLACDFIKQVIKERHWWRELAIEKSKSRDYETAFKATITADAIDKVIELYNEAEAS